jgi:catechol 2,3-dioxygenase-like lactoylglutathione lyase family enzyme
MGGTPAIPAISDRMSHDVPVGDLYHVIHAGDELAPMDDWYDAVFSPRRGILDDDYFEPQQRQASMVAIADCLVEAMAPRRDLAGWESTPMGKFNSRFGSHWHSIAFYTDDVGHLWDRLIEHGIRVVKGGKPGDGVDGRPGEFTPMYTHPRDTITQLEFARRRPRQGWRDLAVPGEVDPRYLPGWSSEWWRTNHPLGIERLSYITVVTGDEEKARRVFVDLLGGTPVLEAHSSLTGTRDVYLSLGTQTVLQISVPENDGSLAGRELATNGEALHAVAFTVGDLEAAAAFLAQKGMRIAGRDDETILVDPTTSFGAAYRFTTFRSPGDPRDERQRSPD